MKDRAGRVLLSLGLSALAGARIVPRTIRQRNIGDIVAETHVTVITESSNDLLLGRIWAKDALLQTSEKPNGSVICKIYNRDRTKFTTFEAYHPRQGGSLFEDAVFDLDSDSLKD